MIKRWSGTGRRRLRTLALLPAGPGEIRFEDVSFSYPSRKSDRPILSRASISRSSRARTVAFVGADRLRKEHGRAPAPAPVGADRRPDHRGCGSAT